MGAPAYKITDRRSSTGYSNNLLYDAATPSPDRKAVQLQSYDTARNLSALGRVVLMSLGRKLFANSNMVRAAVLEQANLAVSTFIPQYFGANRAWGNKAEDWLGEWHKIFDMRGHPYDWDAYLQNLIIGVLRDGDVGTLLTQTAAGYPMIQVIPGHRIRSWISPVNVTLREYQNKRWVIAPDVYAQNGDAVQARMQLIDDNVEPIREDPIEYQARLVDGVVIDDYGAPIAYAIGSENAWDMNLSYVSSRNLFLTFVVEYADQLRGISQLASCSWDFQDSSEFRRLELIAQKSGASINLLETNETGEVDAGKAVLQARPTGPSAEGEATSLVREIFDGGQVRYFKAGSGSKISAFQNERPGMNNMQFEDRVLRGGYTGIEWSIDFGLDPSRIGGAAMRVVIEKINAVLAKRRKMVTKAAKRVDGYGLSKGIKLNLLPEDPDWFKWLYQGPAELTADKKYDSEVDLEEFDHGFVSLKEICARRGQYHDDVRAQRKSEVIAMLADAQEIATQFKITLQEAVSYLEKRNPNPKQGENKVDPAKDQQDKQPANEK